MYQIAGTTYPSMWDAMRAHHYGMSDLDAIREETPAAIAATHEADYPAYSPASIRELTRATVDALEALTDPDPIDPPTVYVPGYGHLCL